MVDYEMIKKILKRIILKVSVVMIFLNWFLEERPGDTKKLTEERFVY